MKISQAVLIIWAYRPAPPPMQSKDNSRALVIKRGRTSTFFTAPSPLSASRQPIGFPGDGHRLQERFGRFVESLWCGPIAQSPIQKKEHRSSTMDRDACDYVPAIVVQFRCS